MADSDDDVPETQTRIPSFRELITNVVYLQRQIPVFQMFPLAFFQELIRARANLDFNRLQIARYYPAVYPAFFPNDPIEPRAPDDDDEPEAQAAPN